MNEFINTHGDQIFNVVFISLLAVTFSVAIYAWRLIGRQHKAFLDAIRKERQEGYLDVRNDRVIFVRTNAPVDPKA